MNATKIPVEILIPALTLGDFDSVYSGIDGKCCCGCSGKHYEREETARAKERGRTVNPRMFKKVLGILQAPGAKVTAGTNNVATVIDGRVYIAYLHED